MKRDMDLVRKILFEIKAKDTPYFRGGLHIEGYSEGQVYYHLSLLSDADLIVSEEIPTMSGDHPLIDVKRMTWKGHEFLDASRDDERWKKAKGIFSKMGGATIDVAIQILTKIMLEQANSLLA